MPKDIIGRENIQLEMSFIRIGMLVRLFQYVYFRLIQFPTWMFKFNRNGNTFKCDGRLFNCNVKISGGGNTLIINQLCRLSNITITITGANHTLVIGRGTRWEENGRIRIEDIGNRIIIGEDCDFRGDFLSCSDKDTTIQIGNDCLFSSNVVIRTSDSHSIIDAAGKRINQGKSVTIGNHVWIGNGGTCLKGTHIEDNCVIGTGAVISNKHIESGSIVVGNPGKIVRTDITWDKKRIY